MHEGEILEQLIKEKSRISVVSKQLSVSRNHLYQLFKKPELTNYQKLAFSKLLNLKEDMLSIEHLEFGQVYYRCIDEFRSHNREDRIKEYLNGYFEPFLKYLSKAKNKIVAKDYLFSKGLAQHNYNVFSQYSHQRKKYFSNLNDVIIERQSSNSDFQFIRIVDLPINHFASQNEFVKEEDVCVETIKLLQYEPFVHIAKNLKKSQDGGDISFKCIFNSRPVVAKSVILIDENYIVLEENSYDPLMASIPRSIEVKKSAISEDLVKSEIAFYYDIVNSIILRKERSAINIMFYHLSYYTSLLKKRLEAEQKTLGLILDDFDNMPLEKLKTELLQVYPKCYYQILNAESKVFILDCLMKMKTENTMNLQNVLDKEMILNEL